MNKITILNYYQLLFMIIIPDNKQFDNYFYTNKSYFSHWSSDFCLSKSFRCFSLFASISVNLRLFILIRVEQKIKIKSIKIISFFLPDYSPLFTLSLFFFFFHFLFNSLFLSFFLLFHISFFLTLHKLNRFLDNHRNCLKQKDSVVRTMVKPNLQQ